jgi:hypothetical protein
MGHNRKERSQTIPVCKWYPHILKDPKDSNKSLFDFISKEEDKCSQKNTRKNKHHEMSQSINEV